MTFENTTNWGRGGETRASGKKASGRLVCDQGKLHSYSRVRGHVTIMWIWSLRGCVGKILKRVSVGPNLSANFKKSCPRTSIRLTRESSGSAAMGLESLS